MKARKVNESSIVTKLFKKKGTALNSGKVRNSDSNLKLAERREKVINSIIDALERELKE